MSIGQGSDILSTGSGMSEPWPIFIQTSALADFFWPLGGQQAVTTFIQHMQQIWGNVNLHVELVFSGVYW